MKKQFFKKISWILLLSLLMPGKFSPARAVVSRASGPFHQTGVMSVIGRQPLVRVAAGADAVPIVSDNGFACPTLTSGPAFSNTNFVQNQGIINLNEPAGCFSLRLGLSLTLPRLVVVPLQPSSIQIVVAVSPAVLWKLAAIPNPVAGRTAEVVSLFLGLLAAAELRKRHSRGQFAKRPARLILGPSIYFLSALRC